MALYFDAEKILRSSFHDGSLKSKVFAANFAQSSPAHVYALISETIKWSPILKEVIDSTGLLDLERKLSPELAVLLVHDHLLSKRGIEANSKHHLRLAVERHRSRIQSEFTKCRLRRKCPDVDSLRKYMLANEGNLTQSKNGKDISTTNFVHPRWIRINVLKSSLEVQLKTTFKGFSRVAHIKELSLEANNPSIMLDKNVPNLLAITPGVDLSKTPAYNDGCLIFQDKASCFPVTLLNLTATDLRILDACAAPGNKTSHAAAVLSSFKLKDFKILACERDETRSKTLENMLLTAGARPYVEIHNGQDFLKTNPDVYPWKDIQAVILDPSCSGSGIIAREDKLNIALPRHTSETSKTVRVKKRKHSHLLEASTASPEVDGSSLSEETLTGPSSNRLAKLAVFQLKILLHAFEFPNAIKIVYSTCSISVEENERVVARAILSDKFKNLGWRILSRDLQVESMKSWSIRGNQEAVSELVDDQSYARIVSDACLRCDKEDDNGTMGFFVVSFVRENDGHSVSTPDEVSDWEGFSDGD